MSIEMLLAYRPIHNTVASMDQAKTITIVPIMVGDMLDDIAELHLDAFAGYLNTLLGRGYVKVFVTWFIRNKGTIAIAAVDHNQKVIGYALGAPMGYSTQLNRDLSLSIAARILARPWLILNSRFRTVLFERMRNFIGLRQNASQVVELPGPAMSLVAIGVASSQRRRKIGQRLMQAVETKARDLQMRSLVLSVYENATATRHFYEQCGWRPYSTVKKNGETLKYWRLLDHTPGVALDSPGPE